MKILIDTHTHTIASGHAYSTIGEMATEAKKCGLEILGITEHGPGMVGTCNKIYFRNLRVVPRQQEGVRLSLGAEVNIMNFDGEIDLDEETLLEMDHVIASLHGNCLDNGTVSENTRAIINAIKNPFVNIIGHPDDSRFVLDYDMVCSAAAENNKLLEVNNSSLKPTSFRVGAKDNYVKMLEKCVKYRTHIALGTDAHVADHVGKFDEVLALLEEVNFPEELVVNTSVEKFREYVAEKKF